MKKIFAWARNTFQGHKTIKLPNGVRITQFGRNAMHFTTQVYVPRKGYFCFQPPAYQNGKWWGWKAYRSPNATPWAATFAAGPGMRTSDKLAAPFRRELLGSWYSSDDDEVYKKLRAINRAVERLMGGRFSMDETEELRSGCSRLEEQVQMGMKDYVALLKIETALRRHELDELTQGDAIDAIAAAVNDWYSREDER